MAKSRLTEYKCQTAKPGRIGDGRNLYLQIRHDLNKSWIYRYRDVEGRDRFHGLGPWPLVSLEEARERALELGRMRLQGRDPLAEARAAKAKGDLAISSIAFQDALERVIESKRPEWKGSASEAQWRASMRDYVLDTLGGVDVRLIEASHVVAVLRPIWDTKLETARRVRNRLEIVLGWCIAMGLANEPNPARLKGNLDVLLPKHRVIVKKDKAKAVRHHPALDWRECPDFMMKLRQMPGVSPQALEFLMLTAVRTANVLEARWDQFDLDAATWSIDAKLMKADRDHVTPLSTRAIAILREMQGKHPELVFPNPRKPEPMSENALLAVIKRMGLKGKMSGHGARSTFATWAQEHAAQFPEDAVRIQLAHGSNDATRDAYLRGNMLDARRVIVQAWDDFLGGKPDTVTRKVVPLRAKKA